MFSRRQFYLGIQNRIKQLENDLLMAEKNSKQLLEQENRQQLQLEQKSTLKSEKSSKVTQAIVAEQDDEDDFETVRYRHEQRIRTQDESLDIISDSLGRLRNVGGEMYLEIESQNRLLDDINDQASGLSQKMEGALSRLDKILHSSSRGQTLSIAFLAVLLIIEIILVSIL